MSYTENDGDGASGAESKQHDEFDILVAKQRKLYVYICNSLDNMRKMGIENVNVHTIDARIARLDDYRNRFTEEHLTIENIYGTVFENEDYFTSDLYEAVEEAWILQRGQLLAWRDRLENSCREPRNSLPPNCPIAKVQQRTRLPRVDIPKFSGRFEDWPTFRDTFRSIVHDDSTLSDIERRHYLVTSVTGEAAALIRGLPTTGASYDLAWSRLAARYENTRVLVNSYLSSYDSLQRMRSATSSEFRRVVEGVIAAVDAMTTIGRPVTNGEDYFVYRAVSLLEDETRREWEKVARSSNNPPTLTSLLDFFEEHLQTLVLMDKRSVPKKILSESTANGRRVHLTSARRENEFTCAACKQNHSLFKCRVYQEKDPRSRYKFALEKHLCFNCLGAHRGDSCESKTTCFLCGERHHTTLHNAIKRDVGRGQPKSSSETKDTPVATVSRAVALSSPASLLATARVFVHDRSGNKCSVRVLFDQGANTSLISETLVNRLCLQRRPSSIRVVGVSGHTMSRGQVKLILSSIRSDECIEVSALILSSLPGHVIPTGCRHVSCKHLKGIPLADPELFAEDPCQIILGSQAYGMALCNGVRKGRLQDPIAQRTIFGWIVSGAIGGSPVRQRLSVHFSSAEMELTDLVRDFWKQEDLPSSSGFSTEEEKECESQYVKTHVRRPDGRYMVRLPVIAPLTDLSSSYRLAVQRLQGLERRFESNAVLHQQYREFMREYDFLGHMSPAVHSGAVPSRVAYLPHHGVMKDTGGLPKLRVVFNGSAALSSGSTLNQHFAVGPNLLPSLADVILKWRYHRYVVVTDIEKMYRQVLVHPEDRGLQTILWRHDSSEPVSEYQLNTITYGLACAPFLAMRTLRQLANDESEKFPVGAAVIAGGVYMDDVLAGASSLREASVIVQELRELCMAGGFPLKKWASNSLELLASVPTEDLADGFRSLRMAEGVAEHSALGLLWDPREDCFTFSVNVSGKLENSKRGVLSQTARLFDPMGWLSPVIIRAKILLQRTWILGVDWDDPLPLEVAETWSRLRGELPLLRKIRLPRWLGSTSSTVGHEVHGFADASELAYAAVVYWRTMTEDGRVSVVLITAKTKVAPLRKVTLPRLELCAAHLLARLVSRLHSFEQFQSASVYLWSDSSVALDWIRGHPSRWQTYVANRVAAIQEAVPSAVWRHIPGTENPADCASRGILPGELVTHPLWWTGPPWLVLDRSCWPSSPDHNTESMSESSAAFVSLAVPAAESLPLLERFSSLRRLLRVSAWCLRWLRCLQTSQGVSACPRSPPVDLLSVDELSAARSRWLRKVQATAYAAELAALQQGRRIGRSSSLERFTPFLDDDGLLRVGGRLRRASLAPDQRHPILLPVSSHLSQLIVAECHERCLHGGVQATLAMIRRTYWIPRSRGLVKRWVNHCIRCVRWRAASVSQFMADLPKARVSPSRPFLHTGLDYAGPFQIRQSGVRGSRLRKGFICLFVCFSTRAVHLEMVSDYTSDGFMAAFVRFVARRGLPSDLYSDQGTNFVGADRALRTLLTTAGQEGKQIYEGVERLSVKWHFNPPASPHCGGLWEAAVKSVKFHLRRVIGDTYLTYEEMSTFLARIEACLNSRPLQALSDDPDDIDALTPGHFLVGAPLSSLPEPSLLDVNVNRLTRWQMVQRMRDHFWKRWRDEYLVSLLHRPKWRIPRTDITVGRLCLVRSELSSPGRWPLARIIALHPGEDGMVRVVSVRTAHSELRRPVTKIVLLPCGEHSSITQDK